MHTTTINRAGWLVAGLLALFVAAAISGVVSGGPLDPPGPPASTLPQVEPRSPIPPVGWNGTFPIVISQPGSYFFTRSLTLTAGSPNADGVQISVSNVSIDLNGFTLAGLDGAGGGLAAIGQISGIHITNGVVRDWANGIDAWSPGREAIYSRVDHITAISNGSGIRLGFDSEISDCNASANTTGIQTHYGIVTRCHATDNVQIGIYVEDVSLVVDSKAWNNSTGIAAGTSGAQPGSSTVRSNTSTNNSNYDLSFGGTGNVSDSNVVTCPGWVNGVGVQTYNAKYQRNIC
jgi:hypothetical protein